MAHPKRRQSSTRRDKRRTHDKLHPKAISICSNTGELHLRHKAYVVDGDLYLNGKVAIKDYAPVAAAVATDNDEE
ncbi:50S ribosomal protein L32 [Hymenobacter taeanensis]|jgi:large subunit ribosomal protein L32|uniref:Large ribosomal subunit protein bL32 n=1 Tax=Hymenobacter taeanensis TaxID=2735321 RepID=A0A6M6BLJ2_9BACT|nr:MULTISPECIES: 50S ribosomal protein L32 [Hymenobacter]QJX48323.1 50S ribosomal protein L32 [Hymenobacter taeanensis]UOQ82187.1 50S ribosomal protein L32 [Hymenobacter sp. 5414T-23]